MQEEFLSDSSWAGESQVSSRSVKLFPSLPGRFMQGQGCSVYAPCQSPDTQPVTKQQPSAQRHGGRAGYLEAADSLPYEPCSFDLSKTKVSSCNFTDGSNSLAGERCARSNRE